MGCDIHPACEIRRYNMWFPAAVPRNDRSYFFFSMLAGVRAYDGREGIPPLAKNRGLPVGVDDVTKDHLVNGDHSGSWCSLVEMRAYDTSHAIAHAKKTWSVYTTDEDALSLWNEWIELGKFMAKHHDVPESDVRFVFNFDS